MSDPERPNLKSKPSAGQVQVQCLMCKSCGLCAEYCPQGLIKPASEIPADQRCGPVINPTGHVVYEVFDPEGRCTGCGICANACPEGAVVVYRRRRSPSSSASPRSSGQAASRGRKEDVNA